MTRISIEDTAIDIVVKMSDGNPGAVACLSMIINAAPEIDPQDLMSPFGPILSLDQHGIYGSSIYVLSTKCNRDVRRLLMLLRAVQLGFLGAGRLKELAADQTRQINLTEEEFARLDEQVCERLDQFSRCLETEA